MKECQLSKRKTFYMHVFCFETSLHKRHKQSKILILMLICNVYSTYMIFLSKQLFILFFSYKNDDLK